MRFETARTGSFPKEWVFNGLIFHDGLHEVASDWNDFIAV